MLENNKPVISVVVPIFKVELYLEECIDSILNQTYSNLEIILIDDGSPDNCPKICDDYKLKDNRIRVIHQENQGLSAARNSGMKIATGEFIAFVDSDDYIAADTYEKLFNAQKKYNADIVTCGICVFNDGDKPNPINSSEISILNRNDALSDYLYDNSKVAVVAWNKLYKLDYFKDILNFEKGRLFEDFIPITKCFIHSERICVVNEELYFYRQRAASINGENFNVKSFNPNVLDLSYSVDTIISIISEYDESLLNSIMPACLKAKLSIANQMIRANSIDDDYIRELQKICKKYKKNISRSTKLRKTEKLKLRLFNNFKIYCAIYKLMKG